MIKNLVWFYATTFGFVAFSQKQSIFRFLKIFNPLTSIQFRKKKEIFFQKFKIAVSFEDGGVRYI